MKVSFLTVTVELSLHHKVQFYKSSIGAKQERSELERPDIRQRDNPNDFIERTERSIMFPDQAVIRFLDWLIHVLTLADTFDVFKSIAKNKTPARTFEFREEKDHQRKQQQQH